MLNSASEKYLAQVLGFGSALITVLVVTGSVTDPVNVTKFLALGGISIAALVLVMGNLNRELLQDLRIQLILGLGFLVASANAIIFSSSPLTQNLYGAYGRNTGFITYLFLFILFLAVSVLRREKSFRFLIWGLLVSGFANVAYCLWAILFGDFIPWSNPYGNILGTFGNPNFIGAFLGVFASVMIAYVIGANVSWKWRMGALVVLAVTTYEIIKSNAIQGRVVLAGGLILVGFFYLRSRSKSLAVPMLYSLFSIIAGVVAVLGALQVGPLTKYIYKTSVSLRGEYWQAGWNMGRDHLGSGIGFDSYGDWYRRARDTQALILPGPNTVTNAAHNVVMDVFAFGGLPLLLVYLCVIAATIRAIIKLFKKKKSYDPVFVALTVGWVCYQTQSIISINQIGLAIWGWLFSGALIAYEKSCGTNDEVSSEVQTKRAVRQSKSAARQSVLSPQLLAGVGLVIGLIFAAPPISADSKWRSALSSSDLKVFEAGLQPGYLNPSNSYRYAMAVQMLEGSKLTEQAVRYARIGVEFNPEYFDAWRMLYVISGSTQEEKDRALEMMKKLDPNNPNVLG